MKILTVDDHALVREGLRQVLKGLDPDVQVLDAATCAMAFEIADAHPDLDLVLLDYHLPDMDGMAALDVFAKTHPELPIIMLSGSVNMPVMGRVLARGAAGFVTKSSLSDELLTALRLVMAGGVYLPLELRAQPAPGGSTEKTTQEAPQFTPRQIEVLELLLAGQSNREISDLLRLSEETVKTHLKTLLRGFGVQTRTQAVVAAAQWGYKGKVLTR